MVPHAPALRAVLERAAVAVLVRDAVAAVPGVTRVRTRVGRHRVTVRARLGFGDRATARREVEEAAAGTLTGCGLARPLRLRTTVTPEPHWQHGARADLTPERPPAAGETTASAGPADRPPDARPATEPAASGATASASLTASGSPMAGGSPTREGTGSDEPTP
ncbi:hypothetical protein G3I19_36675 [Streptomyces sp. SID10853]|nr:hypothetical protein [Streptomyces sp. SID10853]